MAKRKTFYVSAAIFDTPHTAYAVAVYAYLSFCADKQGVCFPSISVIAERCGMSRTTVKKTLSELEQSGLILSQASRQVSKTGKVRRGTNRYRLLNVPAKAEHTRSCDDLPLSREATYPRSCGDREINNNSKDIMGDVPSVVTMGREATDRDGRNAILENLHLDVFYDRDFAQSVQQTIERMYDAPYVTVNGQRVERDDVRRRLKLLTINHIDYVQRQLDEHGGEVLNGERYLMACIFNAPVDCMVKSACERNAW